MFTFTCEKCGGQFYSKADPSNWRHKLCNACSGKPYKDLPVSNSPSYTPHPVPTTKPQYNNIPPQQVKKEFDDEEYMADIISTYVRLSAMCDEAKITIPVDNLCNWTTSIMIQKGRM